MLVSYHKGFLLEGEATFMERKHFWSRKKPVRQKIYLHSGCEGVCDHAKVHDEVQEKTLECMKASGWGTDFSGWERVVPYDEMMKLAKELDWDVDHLPTGRLTVNYLNDWTVEKAAKKLTGEQFARYCAEYNIQAANAVKTPSYPFHDPRKNNYMYNGRSILSSVNAWEITGYRGTNDYDGPSDDNTKFTLFMDNRFTKEDVERIMLNYWSKLYRVISIEAKLIDKK